MSQPSLTGYRFASFGSESIVEASGPDPEQVLLAAASSVAELSSTLTRFDPGSELCRINRNPEWDIEASGLMLDFVEAALEASRLTGGLVDPTLLPELENAGYRKSWKGSGAGSFPAEASRPAPVPSQRWREIRVDRAAGSLTRPPGTRLDAGGIGKGLAADRAARILEGAPDWSVDCLGDIRVGGRPRPVRIASPDPGDEPLKVIEVKDCAVATSGTTRRSWKRADGSRAHHLIDPRTGRPARSDLIQVTALAPTAVEAEARAKAALLSGLKEASSWLVHGGLIVDCHGQLHDFRKTA